MRLFICLLAALSLAGCASSISSGYGQGGRDADGRSYAEARADNKLSAAVTSALVRDRSVPAMGIKVRTVDGVVTLGGSVPSATASRRAVQLASAVAGVKRVDNRLSIKP
ncbi:MAG: BON domain-containing protein [Chromatiales bacterium]|nr:BON domain-containing protein [Chromatiales bacterium]